MTVQLFRKLRVRLLQVSSKWDHQRNCQNQSFHFEAHSRSKRRGRGIKTRTIHHCPKV